METKEIIKDFFERLLRITHLDGTVLVQEGTDSGRPCVTVTLNVAGDAEILIGKNGSALDALEHVARLLCAGGQEERRIIILDVNGYRSARIERAVSVARQAADRVASTGRPETLEPMNAYERRIVHMALAEHPGVRTESAGDEPARKIIIKPSA